MKALIQGIPYVGAGLILFVSAGTIYWPQAWAFMLLNIACGLATGEWLKRSDSELYAERTKSPADYQEQKGTRLVAICIMAGMAGWMVLMALDAKRFGWTSVPAWVEVCGATLIAGAFLGWIGVMRENSFASAEVRVQKERGQTVISTGPYAIVRHPMYGYAVLLIVGASLLLGSLWGLVGLPVLMSLLGIRALAEEQVLITELPGYLEYAQRVRY